MQKKSHGSTVLMVVKLALWVVGLSVLVIGPLAYSSRRRRGVIKL
jgi:hypothetical protein